MKNKPALGGRQPFIIFSQIFLILFSSITILAQPASQTFNSSGTYIIPAGYSANLTINAWGAGGGGGTNSNGAKGGGGSGAFASITTTLSAGSYAVTVGLGGGAGMAGGSSSFTSIVVAAGGSSTSNATGGTGGTVAASTGVIRIAGANGFGVVGVNGGAGAPGAYAGGNGGNGGIANNGSGSFGNMPGGGGGGKAGPGSGGLSGSGGDGRVVVTVNTILPVKLSGFKACEKQNGIGIEWISSAESDLVKYEVLRSADGISFTVIGDVTARNSSSEVKYSFLDGAPASTTNFYRLRIVNLNGATELSYIVKISLDKNIKTVKLYPNPVTHNTIAIQTSHLPGGDYTGKVFNAAGQSMHLLKFTHTGGAINQPIELPATVKPGVYFLQIDRGGETMIKQSFIAQ